MNCPSTTQSAELTLSEYEKARLAKIARNQAYLEKCGFKSPTKLCRDVISSRKPTRDSDLKSPHKAPAKSVKRKLDDDDDDDDWVPKKQEFLLADDACKDF